MSVTYNIFYLCKLVRNAYFRAISLLLLLGMLGGCSATKYVPEDDALFWDYTIEVKAEKDIPDESAVQTELAGAVRPKPNAKFLGVPLKLLIHNAVGPTEKEKGLKYWLSYKVGQPPVLFSQVDSGRMIGVMQNRMHNRGYFDNNVTSTSEIKNQKGTIIFTAYLDAPYRIRKFQYPQADSLPIYKDLRDLMKYSLIKEGEPYNLQIMMAERERLNERLKNRGYYNFNPDFLVFKVDSTIGNRMVDVYLRVKEDAPKAGLKVYTIDDVFVYTNYSLTDTIPALDTIKYKEYYYIPNDNYIRAKYLLQSVFLERGQPFSQRNHALTITRLMGMGSFQYANIKYEPDTANPYQLDAFIYLTPALKKSLRLEAQAVSKSNNFAGPGFTASFRNRNALKGSELLTVNLITRYETQIGGRGSGLNSYEIGLNTELTFPRIIAPFNVNNTRSDFVPRTKMGIGFSILNRVQYFQMHSYTAHYSYNFRPKRTLTWEIMPINLQFVQLANTTKDFEDFLVKNPFLRRSFEQQFILGSIYQLTYSNQIRHWLKNHFYDMVVLDLSGNTVNAVKSLLGSDKPTPENPRNFISQPRFASRAFSQYIRLENDFRYYYNFTKTNILATRLLTGVGYAYGNSTALPYIKQFSIGGTNSIRAFRARSIGPGTYNLPNEQAVSFFDQTGEIKLETNVEYRFPLTDIFRGAIFVDAGNIWLIDEDTVRQGGEFVPGKFLQQLAVGTGVGLRVDVEFFVLRFDLGIPLRRPALTADLRNAISDFKFGFSGENSMVLNIAIGYPF